jgi:hypothetical protein
MQVNIAAIAAVDDADWMVMRIYPGNPCNDLADHNN